MKIICILGKSGSGKSSVEKKLESIGYKRIISYTTRKPRGNEKDGREYHFVSREDFEQLITKKIIIEYAEYAGNYYGAPGPVGSINNVIVVESDGYKKFKEIYGDQVTGVYIDVSDEVADQRKGFRHDTSETEAQKRREVDHSKFEDVKSLVDIVVDGTENLDDIVIKILKHIKDAEKCKK